MTTDNVEEQHHHVSEQVGISVAEPKSPEGQSRQEEKDQIAGYQRRSSSRPLAHKDIAADPKKKGLGYSSSNLKVSDFELMRTIGTG